MVRITAILCRVPVIKFRKGMGSASAPAAHSASASASAPSQAVISH